MASSAWTRVAPALLASVVILITGCSLIANGSQFQGGDAGSGSSDAGDGGTADGPARDGSTDDGAGPADGGTPQSRLSAVEAARRAVFCGCFFGTFLFDNEAQCVSGLDPGVDYVTCTGNVFATNPPSFGPGVACNATAQEAALGCERASNCSVGEFNDCQLRLNEELFSNPSCLLEASYFSDVADCAGDQVVGDPQNDCPGPVLSGSFIVGDNVGSGNDFDLVDSMCFPTNSAGEPVNLGAADQVFQWQAQTPGDVIIDTIGSSFDTILYLIADCTATNSTVCNDDYTNGVLTLRQSRIRTTVAAGEVLNVVIDGFATPAFGAAAANFTALGCVDGDTTAIPRNVGPSVFTGTLGATADDDISSSCAGTPEDGPDAVVAWEAPASGTFTFSTEGSAFDTVLYVRRSCDADDLTSRRGVELACNDDTPTALQSSATASLLAGQTVLIAVESIGGGGDYQIGISGP